MSYFGSFDFWDENINEKMVPDPECIDDKKEEEPKTNE